MKYFSQFVIILLFTVLGELLNRLIPLPIPAAVYGLVLLFLALQLKLVKLEQVKPLGDRMIGLFGLLFVGPTVNVLGCWDQVAPHLLPIAVIIPVSSVAVFAVAGLVTQWLARKGGKQDE